MKKILCNIFLTHIILFAVPAFGQDNIDLKLFSSKFEVYQSDPMIEFIFVLRNGSSKKVAFLNPEFVDVGDNDCAQQL